MPLPPTPTSLKLLRGNPGKRPINHDEPQPESFAAEPPEFLNAEGIAEWNRLVPILMQMKVLTAADYGALANLCKAHSVMLEAFREVAANGLVLDSPQGVKPNPAVKIAHDAMETENRLMQQFGLTPASRSKVRVEKSGPANPWAEVG